MCGIERQFRDPETPGRRKAVMRYDEKEEIEKTDRWLLRINEAKVSDELLYVPSELSRLGVAPRDVVDWTREKDRPTSMAEEAFSLDLDYDSYGAWEWAEPIEKLVEDAIFAILNPDPELPNFNRLVTATKPRQRQKARRKRARTSAKALPPRRANKLASIKSAGART